MRLVRWVILGVLAGLVSTMGPGLNAQGPLATFRGAGPVPGNPNGNSAVRDATRVGTTIYAVGSSGIEATLWTWDSANPVVRAVLPNAPSYVSGTAGVTAGAITRDATYIASQARSSTGLTAVQVRTSDLFTIDLNASPYPSFSANRGATAISTDGSILSGFVNANLGAVRFDVTNQTTTVIPLLPGTTTGNRPAMLGMSSDGTVIVGTSFNASYSGSTNGHAFRYVHGAPGVVSAIPELSGGTWSKAISVSSDGNLTLAGGNSTFLPRGEVYLYDAVGNVTTALGSPNTAWGPANAGGLTSDGSVVVMTFTEPSTSCSPTPCTPPPPARYPYLHNSHGWFHLSSALAAAGVDLGADGWSMEGGTVFGVSPDGTLVFGQTLHENDDPVTGFRRFEGFVAEFPPGFLAGYNPVPVAPANTSIVGAWFFTDPDPDPATANPVILFFLADGTYFHIEANIPASEPGVANGFERGTYTWDSVSKAFTITTLQDTNGDIGFSGSNGVSFIKADVSGDSITFYIEGCPVPDPDCSMGPATRITGGAGSIVGGWVGGNPGVNDSSMVLMFLNDGTYYLAQDGDSNVDPSGHDGIEKGTYTWDPGTGAFTATTTVDTNGEWGLSNPPPGGQTVQLSPDELMFTFTDAEGSATLTRIVPEGTGPPAITAAPQDQTVTAGQTAAFTVSATGTAPLTYQWRKGGVNIAGATSATLTIPNAQASDKGNYRVRVSNVEGSVTSAAAHLDVVQPVLITLQPASDTVVVGKNHNFRVQASGTRPISYQWRKGGVDIAGATDNRLQLTNVQLSGAGSYDVVVSNAAGSVSSNTATLTVLAKPAITAGPADLTVVAGQPATFTVTATGTAPLSYQWRKGGVNIAGATSAMLTIPNAQAANAGNYRVVVSNTAGSITSAAAHLTVH